MGVFVLCRRCFFAFGTVSETYFLEREEIYRSGRKEPPVSCPLRHGLRSELEDFFVPASILMTTWLFNKHNNVLIEESGFQSRYSGERRTFTFKNTQNSKSCSV
jgi:hypothetical protein